MKKIKKAGTLILIVFLFAQLSSCITSLRPLFTAETIITDDRIAGTWKSSKGGLTVQKLVNSRDMEIFNYDIPAQDSVLYSKFYIVTFNPGVYNYSWSGAIVRINDQEFISLSADECLNQQNENVYPAKDKGYEYLNTYSFARLTWKNKDEIEVQFLNGAYIKKTVLENRVRIKYEYDALYNSFLITAGTAEMIDFLKKYGNSEVLYDEEHTIILTRKT